MYALFKFTTQFNFCYVINVKNHQIIKAFGQRLREVRISQSISQEQLANDADIPISQVGRIERGEVNTTISTIFALATALEVNVEELLNLSINKIGKK